MTLHAGRVGVVAGAKLDDFEDVAMSLAECLRAYGSCMLPDSTRKKLYPLVQKLVGDSSGEDTSLLWSGGGLWSHLVCARPARLVLC